MDDPSIIVGVRVVPLDEPPFIPRDAAELRIFMTVCAIDAAMIYAVMRYVRRIALVRWIERARMAGLTALTAFNLGLFVWAVLALFAPDVAPVRPPLLIIAVGLLLAWAWAEFSSWWNKRGLNTLLGL